MVSRIIDNLNAQLVLAGLILLLGIANASAAGVFSTNEALDKLKAAKIVDPKYSLALTMNEKEASVVVERNPKETEKDCKIDALLIAKTLMGAYPSDILRTKVIFSVSELENIEQVIVTAGDIKSFNSGQIDRTALLESIEMEKVSDKEEVDQGDIGSRTGVVSGEREPWRLATLARIQTLATKGVNTQVFMQEFDQIENMVNRGKSPDLVTALKKLNGQLTEQNELTAEAQLRPLHNSARRANSSSTSGLRQRQPRFNQRILDLVKERIGSLQQQGQTINDWAPVLERIQSLVQSGEIENANRLLRGLARELGIDLARAKFTQNTQTNQYDSQAKRNQ